MDSSVLRTAANLQPGHLWHTLASIPVDLAADNTGWWERADMVGQNGPLVSFVLATHNRCAVVADTLSRVRRCGLDRTDYEIIAVDNASTDGTPETLEAQCDRVLRLSVNVGSCAKSLGAEQARGNYIVFLDDDSAPRPGSVERMVGHFESDSRLGAAGFSIHLENGAMEGAALPGVFVGCGVGFRAEALRAAGGLDASFFMQAEEYDLAFRLRWSGWRVLVFDDLHVDHLKTPQARKSGRTIYYDIRNNLRVAARYLPASHFRVYREDWMQRYRWIAANEGHMPAYVRGAWSGVALGTRERFGFRSRRLSPAALEEFFGWDSTAKKMAGLSKSGVNRVVLAGLGKNVFAFHRAASLAGICVVAIGDDRFASVGRRYRRTAVVPVAKALKLRPDAVVVADSAPVHGETTFERLRSLVRCPLHFWGRCNAEPAREGFFSPPKAKPVDDPKVKTALA